MAERKRRPGRGSIYVSVCTAIIAVAISIIVNEEDVIVFRLKGALFRQCIIGSIASGIQYQQEHRARALSY